MLPDIWASGQHLITGPLGTQKANIVGNAPLKSLLSVYAQIWKNKEAPAADQTQDGTTWGQDFGKGNIGLLPGDYGFFTTFEKEGLPAADFADVPLPSENGGHGSTFDGGDDFVIPEGAKNPSGAWEVVQWFLAKAQQEQYAADGESPVRSDIVTPAFTAKYPYEAVALNTLQVRLGRVHARLQRRVQQPRSPVAEDVRRSGLQRQRQPGSPDRAKRHPVDARRGRQLERPHDTHDAAGRFAGPAALSSPSDDLIGDVTAPSETHNSDWR